MADYPHYYRNLLEGFIEHPNPSFKQIELVGGCSLMRTSIGLRSQARSFPASRPDRAMINCRIF